MMRTANGIMGELEIDTSILVFATHRRAPAAFADFEEKEKTLMNKA